ncbi:MAG: protein translocase subunit SecF [Dehalococcoidia bacterium]|nr:protein translocase subunit SecF [Dehalococcoidia bacterium]MSQ34541.1 protein translocase subunit SecF [Dehalococcoidia bacterium]
MIDIIGKRKYFVGFSLILVLASIVALVYPGLRLGVDFTSGTSINILFTGTDPGTENTRLAFADAGYDEAVVQRSGDKEYFVRTRDLSETGRDKVEAALKARTGPEYRILEVSTVGAAVARETIRTAILATLVGTGFVMAYIMYSFRAVPSSYRFAIASVIPLVHDVVITMGVFAILGRVIGAEVNAIFIVGILTLIGYTVNNTIVVFDRVRENVRVAPARPFRQTVNLAINETLVRNLNVSITTLIAILAMILLGGDSLRDLLLVLFLGLLVGTYSSTVIAAQILVAWESGELGRIVRLRFLRRRKAPIQAQPQPQSQQA